MKERFVKATVIPSSMSAEEIDVSQVPVHRLNLNLLYPLDAIMHSSTLTEAGRRVHLSQSAMSHALRRLRDHFNDDLVIYSTGQPQLTPLGLELRGEVRRVLRDLDGTLNHSLSLDPSTIKGTITVAASDVTEQMLLGSVLRRVLSSAPELTLNVIPLDIDAPHKALDRGAELLILPAEAALPELETLPIINDDVGCLVWAGHSQLNDRYSIDEGMYRAALHVTASGERLSILAGDQHAVELLKARRIAMRTTSQAALPAIIIGSDLIATGSLWLFQHYASMMPLKVVSGPFTTRQAPIVAQWTAQRRRGPMLAWFVKQIEAHARWFPRHG